MGTLIQNLVGNNPFNFTAEELSQNYLTIEAGRVVTIISKSIILCNTMIALNTKHFAGACKMALSISSTSVRFLLLVTTIPKPFIK